MRDADFAEDGDFRFAPVALLLFLDGCFALRARGDAVAALAPVDRFLAAGRALAFGSAAPA